MAVICGETYKEHFKKFAQELHEIADYNYDKADTKASVKAVAVLLDRLADMETPFHQLDDFCEHLLTLAANVQEAVANGMSGRGLRCSVCGGEMHPTNESIYLAKRYVDDKDVLLCQRCAENTSVRKGHGGISYAEKSYIEAVLAIGGKTEKDGN